MMIKEMILGAVIVVSCGMYGVQAFRSRDGAFFCVKIPETCEIDEAGRRFDELPTFVNIIDADSAECPNLEGKGSVIRINGDDVTYLQFCELIEKEVRNKKLTCGDPLPHGLVFLQLHKAFDRCNIVLAKKSCCYFAGYLGYHEGTWVKRLHISDSFCERLVCSFKVKIGDDDSSIKADIMPGCDKTVQFSVGEVCCGSVDLPELEDFLAAEELTTQASASPDGLSCTLMKDSEDAASRLLTMFI